MSDNGHVEVRITPAHDWQSEALLLRRAFATQETMLEAQRREIARLRGQLWRMNALLIGLSLGVLLLEALAALLRR